MDFIKSANRYLVEMDDDKRVLTRQEKDEMIRDANRLTANAWMKKYKVGDWLDYKNQFNRMLGREEQIGEADDENQEAPETPEAETAEGNSEKGFVTDIEKDTKANNDFRRVLYTGKTSQLVLMSLKANEDIGEEVHKDIDQFFRIDDGDGVVVINDVEHKIQNGSAFVVPQGAKHNIIAGENGLKLYSIYSPPNHKDGTIHKTKEDAQKAKEHFDGQTSEK
jgi:mannose-6-phosphate isomerase-like protein (cupin superfamily)